MHTEAGSHTKVQSRFRFLPLPSRLRSLAASISLLLRASHFLFRPILLRYVRETLTLRARIHPASGGSLSRELGVQEHDDDDCEARRRTEIILFDSSIGHEALLWVSTFPQFDTEMTRKTRSIFSP